MLVSLKGTVQLPDSGYTHTVVMTPTFQIKPHDTWYQSAEAGDLILEMIHQHEWQYYRLTIPGLGECKVSSTLQGIGLDPSKVPDTVIQYLLTGDLKWLNIQLDS